ncbi:molybdopterin-guanine dinucleotide biosynthesis protein B [Escherichia coli]|nr:molybdopterin-guanine dinucleotide biosynthesis protein B [Escherichia coli]
MAGKTMIPLLAFAAWSGTGKTTLLKKIDPGIMRQRDPSGAD